MEDISYPKKKNCMTIDLSKEEEEDLDDR